MPPDLVERAREFASAAHRSAGQLRKYSGAPYEEHLHAVAEIVASVSDDAEMIAAAWLHDVVEDTPTTIEDVERGFGRGVRDLVDALTDVSRPHHGNRALRKALDREHLARAPARAQTVKLADLIDNCQDIARRSPRFAVTFLEEMAALLGVLTAGDAKLRRRAQSMHARWSQRLGRAPAPSPVELPTIPAAVGQLRVSRALQHFLCVFRASDLAVPLPDPATSTASPSARLPARVSGALRSVQRTQLLPADASIADVVLALTRHEVCLVGTPGAVTSYIRRDELQGPVGRMWLFGIVTSVELAMTEVIRAAGDELDWQAMLAPARVEKARSLQQARTLQGRSVPLLDCLQLADKIRIVLAADPKPRPLLRGRSKAESQRLARDLEDLRNDLAHAQDIVTHDWVQIARLATWLDTWALHMAETRHAVTADPQTARGG